MLIAISVLLVICPAIACSKLSPEKVTIGVILEDKMHLNQSVFASIVDQVNSLYDSHAPVFDVEVAHWPSINPYMAIQSMCRMIAEKIAIFITATSCSTHLSLAALATEKHVIQIALNVRSCVHSGHDIESGASGSGRPDLYPYSFDFLVDLKSTVDVVVGDVVRLEEWTSVVLLYDDSVFRERALSIKNNIQGNTNSASSVKFHEIKLFLERGKMTLLTTRLTDIIKDGEFYNFIVLASRDHTIDIINTAKSLGVKGKDYNWLIANQEITEEDLKLMDNTTRAVAIIRKLSYDAPSSLYVKDDRLSHPPATLHGRGDYEYFSDAIRLAAKVVNVTSNQVDWEALKDLRCSTQNTASFGSGDKLLGMLVVAELQGTTGRIKFDKKTGNLVDYISLQLKQTVTTNDAGKNWKDIGSWDQDNGLNLTQPRAFETGFSSLQDMTLRIVTIEEHPFIIKKVVNGREEWDGCCIDILKAIQKELNTNRFQYEIYEVEDNKYGVVNEDGRWTGLIGDILYKKAHMAVAGMIRNYARELVVDFTASYMDYGVSILIPKPQKTTSIFGFLEPLTVQVWICISIATFCVGLMLFVLSRLSPFSRYNQLGTDEFNFKNSMWFALASLMQQGGDATPLCISGRILGTFWWFFTLIIIATYTANLAAFLTVTRMETPIESLQGLASQTKVPYGTVHESSLEEFFRDQAKIDPLYERIWNYMDTTDPSPMVKDESEGIKRVLDGNYAFLWDDPVLQYHKKLHCNKLTTVGKPFNRKNYAFAVPKGAPYWETITMSILRLQESGELDKIKSKWFEGESSCADDESIGSGKEAEGIAIKNVAGVFYILAMGAGLAFITAMTELIWHKYLSRTSAP